MKKIITFTAIATSILLTACGGGGDDKNTENTNTVERFENGDRFYNVQYSNSRGSDSFVVTYNEVQNNKFIYGNTNKALDVYILTENKLYTPRDIAENTMTINSPTHWTYNTIGNVKTDYGYERINLNNANIFDTVLPGYRENMQNNLNIMAHNFLRNHGTCMFPAGSACYRLVSSKKRTEYLNFTIDQEQKKTFNEILEENRKQEISFNPENSYTKPRMIEGVWQDIPWTAFYYPAWKVIDIDSTAVEFNQKNYEAVFRHNEKMIVSEKIDQLKYLLSLETDQKEILDYKLQIAQLSSGCVFYNATAASVFNSISVFR